MNTELMSLLFVYMMVYLVASWVFYAVDRNFGRHLYRRWHDFTREEPLAETTIRGFVCGRKGRDQFKMAFVLSILVTVLMAMFVKNGMAAWFCAWMLGFPTTIVGFILGPIIAKLWAKRTAVYDAIDTIEAGETPEVVTTVKRTLIEKLNWMWPKDRRPKPVQEPVVEPVAKETVNPAEKTPQSKAEPDMTPEQMIDQFTKGG